MGFDLKRACVKLAKLTEGFDFDEIDDNLESPFANVFSNENIIKSCDYTDKDHIPLIKKAIKEVDITNKAISESLNNILTHADFNDKDILLLLKKILVDTSTFDDIDVYTLFEKKFRDILINNKDTILKNALYWLGCITLFSDYEVADSDVRCRKLSGNLCLDYENFLKSASKYEATLNIKIPLETYFLAFLMDASYVGWDILLEGEYEFNREEIYGVNLNYINVNDDKNNTIVFFTKKDKELYKIYSGMFEDFSNDSYINDCMYNCVDDYYTNDDDYYDYYDKDDY